jgi:hypothetical protein
MKKIGRLIHLAAEKAAFSTFFAWASQLKVVMPRVLNFQFA